MSDVTNPLAPPHRPTVVRRIQRRSRWRWLSRASLWFRSNLCRRALVLSLLSGCVQHQAPENDVVVVAELGPRPASVAAPTPLPEVRKFGDFHVTFYYVIGEDEVDGPVAKVAAARPIVGATGSAEPANDNAAAAPATAPATELAPAPLAGAEVALASAAPLAAPPEDRRGSSAARASDRVTLYDSAACRPLADVSPTFASEIRMQGTGRLRDGRILNIWGDCSCERSPCFRVTGRQWGSAGNGRALQPFRTVAVDRKVVPTGTLLYIEELDGRQMPGKAPWGGFVHDGCVSADDTGGGIDGHQIDLFVGRRSYYKALSSQDGSHRWSKNVNVVDGSSLCERYRGQVRRARQAS